MASPEQNDRFAEKRVKKNKREWDENNKFSMEETPLEQQTNATSSVTIEVK